MEETEIERLARISIDCGYKIHVEVGPGLLESVYEAVLAESLNRAGLSVERQKRIPIEIAGISLDEGFKADLIVENQLLIELKSVEKIAKVHGKQVLTYLRLMKLPLGLLINFGEAYFKDGVHRVPNNYYGEWRR